MNPLVTETVGTLPVNLSALSFEMQLTPTCRPLSLNCWGVFMHGRWERGVYVQEATFICAAWGPSLPSISAGVILEHVCEVELGSSDLSLIAHPLFTSLCCLTPVSPGSPF